jgi:hypothetical protein
MFAHGKDPKKMIKNLIGGIINKLQIEKYDGRYKSFYISIKYPDQKLKLDAYMNVSQVVAGSDDNIITVLYIDNVNIKDYGGMGLCTVLCTYLLIKLYNETILRFSEKTKFFGKVLVRSETPIIAAACYTKAFGFLGFNFVRSEKNFVGKEGDFYLFYEKIRDPDVAWKKKTDKIIYKNKNITYIISDQKIEVE